MYHPKTVFDSSFAGRLSSYPRDQVVQIKEELLSWKPSGPLLGDANHYNVFDLIQRQDVGQHLSVSGLNDGGTIAFLKGLPEVLEYYRLIIVSKNLLENASTEISENREFIDSLSPVTVDEQGSAGFAGWFFGHPVLVDSYPEDVIYILPMHYSFVNFWQAVCFTSPSEFDGRRSSAIGFDEKEKRLQAVEARLRELAG